MTKEWVMQVRMKEMWETQVMSGRGGSGVSVADSLEASVTEARTAERRDWRSGGEEDCD